MVTILCVFYVRLSMNRQFRKCQKANSCLGQLTVMLCDFGALLLVLSLRAVNAGVEPSREAAPKQLWYDCR